MGVKQYDQARDLVRAVDFLARFTGPRPEALVAKAEAALGARLPPSYRRFLIEFGCGSFEVLNVFGVVDGELERPDRRNVVWLTLNERRTGGFDPAYVLIGTVDGAGTWFALDTRRVDRKGEMPVVKLTCDGTEIKTVAKDFGELFLDQVMAVIKSWQGG